MSRRELARSAISFFQWFIAFAALYVVAILLGSSAKLPPRIQTALFVFGLLWVLPMCMTLGGSIYLIIRAAFAKGEAGV
jgi:hypothetical protein